MVAVLAFYSGDPSLDPAEVHNFYIIQIALKNENKSNRHLELMSSTC